jgi:hypothetical protein
MKNIEDLLLENRGPLPTRELSHNFTATIVGELRTHPHHLTGFQRFKENLHMKLHKPATVFAALGIMLAFGGTAYATDGFTQAPAFLNVVFSTKQRLPSGDRIVAVDTKGCKNVRWDPDISALREGNMTYYYRVSKGSTLTNQQVAQMVQGQCELDNSQNAVTQDELVKLNPANKNTVVGSSAYDVITAISASSLSIHSKMPLGNNQVKEYERKYNHIDPTVIVYDSGSRARIAWSELKVGDHVTLSYRAAGNALKNSEVGSFGELNTDETTIVLVYRLTGNVEAIAEMSRYYGKEIMRAKPCDNDVNSWCNYDDSRTKDVSLTGSSSIVPGTTTTPTPTELVESAYRTYLKSQGNNSDYDYYQKARDTFMQSVTPELATEIRSPHNYDRIMCAQNTPESISFGVGNKDGNTMILPVVVHWSSQDSYTIQVHVNIGTNKISAIECPEMSN